MKQSLVFVTILGFLLLACSAANPTAPPLPTAVPPEVMPAGEDGGWTVSFQHEFGPDFWEAGMHEYGFYVQCPVPGFEDYGSEWLSFKIDNEAPQVENVTVYLRIGGVTTEQFTPSYQQGVAFHSSIPTTAVVYFVGVPEETVQELGQTCDGIITWDGTNTAQLSAIEPFMP